jgi:hypothetical protein
MRRSLSAALLATMVLAWPAHAQPLPTPTGSDPVAPPERVVFDGIVQVVPPNSSGLCMQSGPGRLTITARLTNDPTDMPPRPAAFNLYGLQADPNATVALPVNQSDATITTQLRGTTYCWQLAVDAPPGTNRMSSTQRGTFTQRVALKMTLTP